jgi:hypothetical protein
MRRDPLGTSAQHFITCVRSSILTRRPCAAPPRHPCIRRHHQICAVVNIQISVQVCVCEPVTVRLWCGAVHEGIRNSQSQHLFSCVRQPSADRHRLHIVSSFVLDEPAYIQPDWIDGRCMYMHRLVPFWPTRYDNFERIDRCRLIVSK